MPRLPTLLSPVVIVRRKAMYRGVFGNSTMWKLVAVAVFGRGLLKKIFGRRPEVLAQNALVAGRIMSVATSKPLTKRRQRAVGIDRKALEALARAELESGSTSS